MDPDESAPIRPSQLLQGLSRRQRARGVASLDAPSTIAEEGITDWRAESHRAAAQSEGVCSMTDDRAVPIAAARDRSDPSPSTRRTSSSTAHRALPPHARGQPCHHCGRRRAKRAVVLGRRASSASRWPPRSVLGVSRSTSSPPISSAWTRARSAAWWLSFADTRGAWRGVPSRAQSAADRRWEVVLRAATDSRRPRRGRHRRAAEFWIWPSRRHRIGSRDHGEPLPRASLRGICGG